MEWKQIIPGVFEGVPDKTPQTLQTILDEINISYACRALLGGGKGLSVMQVILANDPAYYDKIMAEARKRLEEGNGDLSNV